MRRSVADPGCRTAMQVQSGAIIRTIRPHVGRVNGNEQVPASSRGQEILE